MVERRVHPFGNTTGSKRAMIWAVCWAWLPDPASRLMSRWGRPNCWKNTGDMLLS